jgi:DNA helicase-2/ATP-dependent DNA helicase PcrA
MQKRLDVMLPNVKGLKIKTFHAFGREILDRSVGEYSDFEVAGDSWVTKAIQGIVRDDLKLAWSNDDIPHNRIKSFIDWQVVHIKGCNDNLIEVENMPYDIGIMKKIYKLYEKRKKADKLIDFGDMLFKAYLTLKDDLAIRRKYQEKYKYICVDEYQDSNLLQVSILKLINVDNVFALGDNNQAIYGFTGATPEFILNFHKEFKNSKVLHLPINYRCTRNIVEYSNRLIAQMEDGQHEFYVEAESHKGYLFDPECNTYASAENEAVNIGRIIRRFVEGKVYNYGDMAILVRLNAQTTILQQAFCHMGLPFIIVGGDQFYNRREIKDILAYLEVINNGCEESFKRIYNKPSRKLGAKFLEGLTDFAKRNNTSSCDSLRQYYNYCDKRYVEGIDKLLAVILGARKRSLKSKVGDLIRYIMEQIDYAEFISKDDSEGIKLENIEGLISQANNYNDVGTFLKEIYAILEFAQKSKSENKDDLNADAIKIMTFHKSKGLQFPVVFCVSVNEGVLPFYRSTEIGEERRLLYVGMTRAEKQLYISTTKAFRNRISEPSSFLSDIFES